MANRFGLLVVQSPCMAEQDTSEIEALLCHHLPQGTGLYLRLYSVRLLCSLRG